MGFFLILKGMFDFDQILSESEFDNFYLFFLIDMVLDMFTFVSITSILKKRGFFQSSL